MNKDSLIRYAEIKSKIKQLQEEADVINVEITSSMNEEGVDKVESDFGNFYFTERKSYTYSEEVALASEAVKELKKKEEESGIAVCDITKTLTFKAK